MASIRVLLLLVAITAAFAGKIPAGHHRLVSLDSRLSADASTRFLQVQLSTEIEKLQSHNLMSNNIIDKAIKKLTEIVNKLKVKIVAAEHKLIDRAQSISEEILSKINDYVQKHLGVDLELVKKWEEFEQKTESCANSLKTDVLTVLLAIRTNTLTCLADELAETKLIGEQVLELSQLLETVPAKTIQRIKACGTEVPVEPTDAPVDPNEAPVDPAGPSGDAVRSVALGSVRSWSGSWKKSVCIVEELTQGFKDLEAVPELIYKLVREIKDLSGAKSKVEQCSEESVAGKGEEVQKAVAQLLFCVIAPTDQQ